MLRLDSVDHNTEELMQEVLETEFHSHTVLSVLHRLCYIHRYDRVAVLDGRVLVEFDSPASFLVIRSWLRFTVLAAIESVTLNAIFKYPMT